MPEFEPRDEFVTLPVQGQSRGNAQVQDGDDVVISNHGQFEGLKLIPNPPDLEAWRERLFHVDDTITLTQEECVPPISLSQMFRT